ncbi:MAG: helix-turn-helix transcriptional regulator [Candidatus Woesebacteria bacterium]|jgi:transcriptional regulator with XRE-family HTH domain
MNIEYQQVFGKRVRELRKERGLSQVELASKVGIDRSYMGFLERGERNPSLEMIAKIAEALSVTPDELLKKSAK